MLNYWSLLGEDFPAWLQAGMLLVLPLTWWWRRQIRDNPRIRTTLNYDTQLVFVMGLGALAWFMFLVNAIQVLVMR